MTWRKFTDDERHLLQLAYYRSHQIRGDWTGPLDTWLDDLNEAIASILHTYYGERANREVVGLLAGTITDSIDYSDPRDDMRAIWPNMERVMEIMGFESRDERHDGNCARCGYGKGSNEYMHSIDADIHNGIEYCNDCHKVVALGYKEYRCETCDFHKIVHGRRPKCLCGNPAERWVR